MSVDDGPTTTPKPTFTDDELALAEETLNKSTWWLRGYLASCQDPYERALLHQALMFLSKRAELWLSLVIAESAEQSESSATKAAVSTVSSTTLSEQPTVSSSSSASADSENGESGEAFDSQRRGKETFHE